MSINHSGPHFNLPALSTSLKQVALVFVIYVRLNPMPGDIFQLEIVAIKCLQGCWGPRHEKINGVSHSKITHCAVLISVSVMIARKYKYWFWYCIRNNLAISKYSISNPNQRLSHNSVLHTRPDNDEA